MPATEIPLLLGAHDSWHCDKNAIASEAKQSHEIATSPRQSGTPRDDQLWLLEANYFILPFIHDTHSQDSEF